MGAILSYSDVLKTYKTQGYRLNKLESFKGIFPINPNAKLAGIISDLIFDGHLQGDPKWRIDYTSKSIEELKRFENEIYDLFAINGKIRECVTNKYGKTYNIGINSAPVSRILFLLGVPNGKKVKNSFNLPFWIKNDRNCFKRFVQRMFSCEGSIMYEKNRKIPQIRLELWKSEEKLDNGLNFIKEITRGLEKYFSIKSTITFPKTRFNYNKDGTITRPIRLYIHSNNVIKFYNEIGFEGVKQKTLKAHIPD